MPSKSLKCDILVVLQNVTTIIPKSNTVNKITYEYTTVNFVDSTKHDIDLSFDEFNLRITHALQGSAPTQRPMTSEELAESSSDSADSKPTPPTSKEITRP